MHPRNPAVAAALAFLLWLAVACPPARAQGLQSTTTFSASPNPGNAGQYVALTATVSGSGARPTGTTTFYADGNVVSGGSAVSLVAGVARINATLAVGQHTLRAQYNGSSTYLSSSSANYTETISLVATVTAAAAASAIYSSTTQSVPLSASVTTSDGTAVIGGSVLFAVYNGSALIGPQNVAAVSGGTANGAFMMQAGTAPGVYTIRASYSGGSTYATSIDSAHTLTVTAPPPTAANAQGVQIIGCNYVVFTGTAYPGSRIGGAFTDMDGDPWPGAGPGQLTFVTTAQSGNDGPWSATLTIPAGLSGTGLVLTVEQTAPGQTAMQTASYGFIEVQTTQPVAVKSFAKVNGQATVTMNGCAGETYQLQCTSSLTAPAWVSVAFAQPTVCGPLTLTDPSAAPQTAIFYRVLVK